MTNKISLPFAISVIIAFMTANSLITAPFFGGGILTFLISLFVGGAVLSILSKPLARFFTAQHNTAFRKILYALIIVPCILVAGFAARQYCIFIYRAVLVKSSIWLIKITFCLCAFFLAVSEKIAVYKFSLLAAIMSSGVFSVLFLLSEKTFNIKNLYGIFDFTYFSLSQTGIYLLKMVLPTVIAIAFIGSSGDTIPRRTAALGFALGVGLTLTVVFDSILSFGLPLSAKLEYPYIDDISTVNVGSLFTRMDAFAYFAFFNCYIIKCAVCLKLASQLARLIGIKAEKIFCAVAACVLLVF